MNAWGRILLPAGFGIAAGALNLFVINLKVTPQDFVVVNRDMEIGEEISESDLDWISLSGNIERLKSTAVLYESRTVVCGKKAVRSLKQNDLLLFSDAVQSIELQPGLKEDSLPVSLDHVAHVPSLLLVGEQVGFVVNASSSDSPHSDQSIVPEYIGPFRLLSVGRRLKRADVDATQSQELENGDNVIHVGIVFEDEKKTRLSAESKKLVAAAPAGRIIGLILLKHQSLPHESSSGADGVETTTSND